MCRHMEHFLNQHTIPWSREDHWLTARMNHSIFICRMNLFSGFETNVRTQSLTLRPKKATECIVINLGLPQRRSHLRRAIVFPANPMPETQYLQR